MTDLGRPSDRAWMVGSVVKEPVVASAERFARARWVARVRWVPGAACPPLEFPAAAAKLLLAPARCPCRAQYFRLVHRLRYPVP